MAARQRGPAWPPARPSAKMRPDMANAAPSPLWPRDARAACAFTFDVDAESLWLARGVEEPVALSQGRFGAVEALPRILALLKAAEIRASFFVPAWVAEHHADAIKTIAAEGHGWACRGDGPGGSPARGPGREVAILNRGLGVPPPRAGRRPVGSRARAWHLPAAPRRLLTEEVLDYSSNRMDPLPPYLPPP